MIKQYIFSVTNQPTFDTIEYLLDNKFLV